MLRAFFLIFALISVALVAVLGFRGEKSSRPEIEIFPDMVRQPKVRAQSESNFFSDQRGARKPVEGTVPLGYEMPSPNEPGGADELKMRSGLRFSTGTDYFNTGKMGANWGTGIPLEVTPALMRRGEERFNINCTVCHGPLGAGDGIVKGYGLATVVTLQDERIRNMSDGEIFDTITHGKNTMMAYGSRVTVEDRWAIISYLRALQRSQRASAADVPPQHLAEMDKKEEPAPAAEPEKK